MSKTEKFLKQWVKEAAHKTPLAEIKSHILRHAQELSDPTRNAPLSWSASMRNLLDMYDTKTKVTVTPGHQIYKFAKKYLHHRNKKLSWLQGPPKGKIPRNVKILFSSSGKLRKGERVLTVKKLRSLL